MAGVAGGAVLLTLTDRKSRFLFGVRLEKKTTEGVSAAIIEGLIEQPPHTPKRSKCMYNPAASIRYIMPFSFRWSCR